MSRIQGIVGSILFTFLLPFLLPNSVFGAAPLSPGGSPLEQLIVQACPAPPIACTLPGEVRSLVFADKQTVSWTQPLDPGAPPPIQYNTLRAPNASDFINNYFAPCIEIDGTDQTSTDAQNPGLGTAFFYEIAAKTVCGVGTMAAASDGRPHLASSCAARSAGFEAPNDGSIPPERENIERRPDSKNVGAVYLFSGEYHYEQVDLQVPGRGINVTWGRKYRSREGRLTPMGYNWDFTYNKSVAISSDNSADRWVYDGDSRRDTYTSIGGNCWTAVGFFRELCLQADNRYTLTFPDKLTWTFGALDGSPTSGRLVEIRDRNQNQIILSYNGLGQLVTITDTLGRLFTIAYTIDGFISQLTDFAGRQVRYGYYQATDTGGSVGDLKFCRSPDVIGTPNGNDFPSGKTTTYAYTKGLTPDARNHNMISITDPIGQVFVLNTYTTSTNSSDPAFDRVARQSFAGGVVTYVHAQQNPSAENNQATTKTIVKDGVGNVREAFFNSKNQIVMLREYTGRAPNPLQPTNDSFNRPTGKLRAEDPAYFESRFEYNTDSLRTRFVFPNDSSMQRVFESDLSPGAPRRMQGNLRETHRFPGPLGADQAELVERLEYTPGFGGCCGDSFVSRRVDARGNETLHIYDTAGNRIHTQHRVPTIVEDFEYNAFGQRTARIFPSNGSGWRRRDQYSYYAAGPQTAYLSARTIDALGRSLTTTYEYDNVGNIIRQVDARGHDTLYSVNSLNQVVRETLPEVTDGSGVRYNRDTYYDGNDRVIRLDVQNVDDAGVVHPTDPSTTLFIFDNLNNITLEIQKVDLSRSMKTQYAYDANQNLSQIRLGEATNGHQPANVVNFLYDERDQLFRKGLCQSTTQSDYDCNGNLRVLREGIESQPRETQHDRDGFDRVLTTTDGMGNVVRYHYDANNNVVSERTEGEAIDVNGSAGNIRLAEETHVFDPMDRETQNDVAFFDTDTQTDIGDGKATTLTEYNDVSQVTRVVDDNGHDERYTYDTTLQPLRVTDARGNSLTYSYDPNLNVTRKTELEVGDLGFPSQSFSTDSSFDNLDRLTTLVDPRASKVEYRHDSRNNTTQMIDAIRPNNATDPGNVTTYSYDSANRMLNVTRRLTYDGTGTGPPVGTIVNTMALDDSSRLTDECDGNGNCTHHVYDCQDRQIQTTYADGTTDMFTYDPHDNVVHSVDANASQVTATYDLLDGVTSKAIVPGPGVANSTSTESYQYDGLSRVVRAYDDQSLITRSYDSLSHLVRESLDGAETRSVFDAMGNLTRLSYPGGRTITTTYDVLDRKKRISDQSLVVADYSFLGPGRILERDYGNGTRALFSYDGAFGSPNPPGDFGAKQVVRLTHSVIATGSRIDDRVFLWDRVGNKTRRDDLLATAPSQTRRYDYHYDSTYRLDRTTVSDSGLSVLRVTDYSLDPSGNRSFVSGTGGGAYTRDAGAPEPADSQMNQYTQTPFDSRTYDAKGNLIAEQNFSSPAPLALEYDYDNRLVHVDDPSNGMSVDYTYDVFGRRIRKVINTGGPPQITRYLFNDLQEIEERDGSGSTQATYVYGNSADEVLSMRRGGNDYYYHADDIGNVMALTSATGTVVERYDYDDFGNPRNVSLVGNPYLFTGRRFDSETGLYFYRTRYQDPRAGRFISRDHLGPWGDSVNSGNALTYVGNNPWSLTDPTGEYVQPTFDSSCEGNRSEILDALERGQDLARWSYYHLASRTPITQACDLRYLQWFGMYNVSRYHTVKHNVSDIMHAFGQNSYNFKCSDNPISWQMCDKYLGYVKPGAGDFHNIWLCPSFMDNDMEHQGGLIFHELSHLVAGTEDHEYGSARCARLARNEPHRAIENATNYQNFSLSNLGGFCSPLSMFGEMAINFMRDEISRAGRAIERGAKGATHFAKRAAAKIKAHLPGHRHHHHH